MQSWGFDAEFCEGIHEVLLGNCELRELTGKRLSQTGHIFIALSVVFEQLEAGLQVQIHGTRPTAKLLRKSLPGILWGDQIDSK